LLAALLTSCASPPERRSLAEADYPGVLRAPESLPFDVVWQQRVTASWGDGQQRGFDAAVQKRGLGLTVLGLSPMGSIGFAIVMRGDAIEVENHTSEELPFPPRFILLDVQRALYPWLPDGLAVDGATGERGAHVDGERIVERWQNGQLVERRFRRDGEFEQDIVVHYEWKNPGWRGPSRVVLDNAWFGYETTNR
jgi:hypothetical protein